MIGPFQFDNLPAALALWIILYSCDYYLSIHANQLRAKYAESHFGFDGSFELNPYYQKDIDANRRVSQRFLLMLLLFILWLALIYILAFSLKIPELFSVGVGYLLLLELPILDGHVANITLFNSMKTPSAVVGSIAFARWVNL